MQSRYCAKPPRRPRLLRNPRRVLDDAAKRGAKSFPIETVPFGERHRHRYGERVSSTRYTCWPRTRVSTTLSEPASVKRAPSTSCALSAFLVTASSGLRPGGPRYTKSPDRPSEKSSVSLSHPSPPRPARP